jgi:hypothetical protein
MEVEIIPFKINVIMEFCFDIVKLKEEMKIYQYFDYMSINC